MNTIFKDNKGNLRNTNIDMFYEVALSNYTLYISNIKRFPEYENIEDKLPSELKDIARVLLYEKESRNFNYVITSIVFLQNFYEGLINEIGLIDFGQKYYKTYLDKLGVKEKWEIVLKLVYNQTLNKEAQYYEDFQNVISFRNKISHYKSNIITKENLSEIGNSTIVKAYDVVEKGMKSSIDLLKDLIEMDKNKKILIHFDFSRVIKKKFSI